MANIHAIYGDQWMDVVPTKKQNNNNNDCIIFLENSFFNNTTINSNKNKHVLQ